MQDRRPKPPGLRDVLQGVPRAFLDIALRRLRPRHGNAGYGIVIDADVPVLYSSSARDAPIGMAHSLRGRKRAVILVAFIGSMERPGRIRRLRQAAVAHRLRHPGRRIVFAANSRKETDLLNEAGEVAALLNHNLFVSTSIFRPLPPRPVIHDAIYNARLAPFKRHELALDVESCAFIYYHTSKETAEFDAALRERHERHSPGHVFLNPLKDGVPVLLSPEEVNAAYAQAAVGLCLSAVEGAMFASMEYMLAGLPIVSTPSRGGRDTYFDDEYCMIVEPDPRVVRDAVAAMKARAIPRDYIAARTREKVARDRARLSDLVNGLREEAGLPPRPADDLFEREQVLAWRRWDAFIAELERMEAAARPAQMA